MPRNRRMDDSMNSEADVVMDGVREYGDGLPVRLSAAVGRFTRGVDPSEWQGNGRAVVKALAEGGHCTTEVDLHDLLVWLIRHRPQLVDAALDEVIAAGRADLTCEARRQPDAVHGATHVQAGSRAEIDRRAFYRVLKLRMAATLSFLQKW